MSKPFPYYIPPDARGNEQDPVVYLYQRLLEQQHQIDELRRDLALTQQKYGSPFSNVRKAEGPVDLGSAPKPVVKASDKELVITGYDPAPKHATIAPVVQPALTINDEWHKTLDLLNNGTEHVFLTGGAGVGKSTLLNKWVSETYRSVAIVAPTGVAALRINGQTIHSFFRIDPAELDMEYIPDLREKDRARLKYLDTLIIDEISMVRADLMDTIERTLREYGPQKGTAFGGVRLIMIGDLFQLPPVVSDKDKKKPLENFLTAHYGTKQPFFFHATCWRDNPPRMVELTTVFRQNDLTFVNALNAIRRGTLSSEHTAILNAHTNPAFRAPADELWMRLVTTNAKAKEANELMISQLPGDGKDFIGKKTGDFGNDLPTDEVLTLKPGVAVMFIKNDNKDHRWVNGTLGKVVEVDPFLAVEIDGLARIITSETWESVGYEYDPAVKKLTKTVKGSYTQIPLKIAAAATIHKVQGTTLERAILDLGWGTFADGQLYVGLSRLISLDGLVLARNIKPDDVKVSKEVQRYMAGEAIARPAALLF